jgi:hypothetical protein
MKHYILIMWPESQELMDQEWFDNEAVLANPGHESHELYGKSSAYFIPKERLEQKSDPKEQFLQDLELKVTPSGLTGSFMTCKDAPSYGWSREEYMYMPVVADRLRAKGFRVSSSVNHGVTDWVIAR